MPILELRCRNCDRIFASMIDKPFCSLCDSQMKFDSEAERLEKLKYKNKKVRIP